MDKLRSVPKLHVRYKRFQKEQRDIWESFLIIEFYTPKIIESIKNDSFPSLTVDRIWNTSERILNKNNTYGALTSLEKRGNFRRTLLELVLVFEDYMSDLIEMVYLDIPNKLTSIQDDSNNSGYQKLLKLMLSSSNKEEIIERLVEEKIRGIFYGNPLDVFEKDKAKLEFGTFFKDNYSSEINKFKEIIAARNVVAHNNGKIDRKYLREVNSTATLGEKIKIDREFIKNSVYILSLLAAQSARLVVERIYKEIPSGNLGRAIASFEK
ncbi:hypothetical protein WDU86_00160 [Klebsiella pneumoniae]|nr:MULTISPECIES: hypothetical protein [Klebsiella]MCD1150024.1 hypothetical protein [Klebsiella pneumoniae]MCD1155288.1 hypothetical protein [Klebsiella pneumoniae]MCM5854110.1 hypothetical protein [Klebsiella pneumoniae]MCQ3900907.1 hypothetical protein [Klebsiella variicola]MCW9595724.1 hypothetical protein [Klebsiella michiganensis]